MGKTNKEVMELLAKLSPDALRVVATVLEHRSNSAVAVISIMPLKSDISKAYSVLGALADAAIEIAEQRLFDEEVEERKEAEFESRYCSATPL